MVERPLQYQARRFGLGSNCALMAMPEACASYLLSLHNFIHHVRRPGTLLLCPWAEGPLRADMERIRDGAFNWHHEVTAFKIPTGVGTFILSAFDEVNVPKMQVGNDVFSCWPGSEVRKALEDLGVAWEAPQLSDVQFQEYLLEVARRAEDLWPGCIKVYLQYDHRRAPMVRQQRLNQLNGLATECLGWPVVQIRDEIEEATGVWCHYPPGVRQEGSGTRLSNLKE